MVCNYIICSLFIQACSKPRRYSVSVSLMVRIRHILYILFYKPTWYLPDISCPLYTVQHSYRCVSYTFHIIGQASLVWFGNHRNGGFSLEEPRPIVLALRWLPSPLAKILKFGLNFENWPKFWKGWVAIAKLKQLVEAPPMRSLHFCWYQTNPN